MTSPLSRAGMLAALLVLVLAACGGGAAPTASPTAEPTPAPTSTPGASEAPSATAEPNTGDATLDAPDEVEAGAAFEVAWTGPDNAGDFVTVVAAGTTAWSNQDYFNTHNGSPGELTAPLTAGEYEVWYVSNADDSVVARRPITITPFTGGLLGPDEVAGGTEFEVAWNGPDGSGDYITIVPVGAGVADYLSYDETSDGSPAHLIAPITAGAYELRYVTGTPRTVMLTRPITVLAVVASVDGPESVKVGEEFEVAWTGPNGPGDYITIVPAGSAAGAYLSYDEASDGSPSEIEAPDDPGDYELWYVIPGRRGEPTTVVARQPIEVVP